MKAVDILTAGSFLVFAAGCATVPKDAPDELHAADRAIEQAKDIDADNTAPKTMKNAEKKLDNAVSLFDKSKDKETDSGDKLAEAKKEAISAQKMAESATNLRTDVLAWDNDDLQAYVTLKDQGTQLETARTELAKLKAQGQAEVSPQSLEGYRPVAFFHTDKATLDQSMAMALEPLVKLLKENKEMEVTLVGYADPRGADGYNMTLSEERAATISKYLQSEGIDSSRIKAEGKGTKGAIGDHANLAQMQLDRRVDAMVHPVAH